MRNFPSDTSIADAKEAVLKDLPGDAHVATFSVRSNCALIEVRSASLEQDLKEAGFPTSIWIAEFNNSGAGATHTVYDPSSVDTVLSSVENKGWAPHC